MTGTDHVLLTGHDVEAERLDDWRILFAELRARFRTADFASALRLVDAIGAAAEAADHHPDLALSWGRVDVRLSSHDAGGVTGRDVTLARTISDLAREAGATPAPDGLGVVELALDSPDHTAVRPFWIAVLGYEPGPKPDELHDPTGTHPAIWFQHSDPGSTGPDGPGSGDTTPRQRWHLDVRVPPEVAPDRIRAALAAGGTLVSDAAAPAFVVLADAQGNQACVTTWQGRG